MPSSSKVTIDEIARLAGVSKKSVSRVLNDERGVSAATRATVQRIMREHDYQPDRRARALAANRSYLVALVYDNANPGYVVNVLEGVAQSVNARGYEVVAHPAYGEGQAAADAVHGFMRRSGCDGLILTPPMAESIEMVSFCASGGWPMVRIAGDDAALAVPQVRFDDRAGCFAVTRHLVEQGHRTFGFVGGPEHSGPTRRRLAGFRDALSTQSLDVRDPHIQWGDFRFQSGVAAGTAILDSQSRPTAIVCCNDEMAAGVLHAAREAHLEVPGELAVTGFDDAAIAQEVWPQLTTVRQPVREMGQLAGDALVATIEQRDPDRSAPQPPPIEVIRRASSDHAFST